MKRRYLAKTPRDANGRQRPTRLYQIFNNMRSRVNGSGTKRPDLYKGLRVEWKSFVEFRAWALRTGFCKGMSPDRIDTDRGYVADNIRWVPIHENRMRALIEAGCCGGHDGVRGPEPDYEESDDFWQMGGTTVFADGDEVPF